MDWDEKAIREMNAILQSKHREMQRAQGTDRRNFSAIWNRYLNAYNASVIGITRKDVKRNEPNMALFLNLANMVNYRNDLVSDALILDNPDRLGQYIVIKRDMAEKILILGMI